MPPPFSCPLSPVARLLPPLIFPLTGCSGIAKAPDSDKPHHTAQGYQNNYSGNVDKPFSQLLRWQADRIKNGSVALAVSSAFDYAECLTEKA